MTSSTYAVRSGNGAFRRIFGAPLLLGVMTLAGLIGALIGDGWWDRLSAVLLAVPLSALVWIVLRAGRRRGRR